MQPQDQFKLNSAINLSARVNWKLALGLPMMVLLACYLISRSALFIPGKDILSNAILADVLITAPLLYFLAIRKTTVSNWIILVLGTFLCLFMMETIGVHFLIALWKPVVAWIFTILSLYTCLQLFAHIRATRSRPTRIGASALELHNGLAADVTIEFDNVDEIVLSKKISTDGRQVKLALLNGLEPHNVVIRLKKMIVVTKIFGILKRADVILFHIDRPIEFVQSLEDAIASSAIKIR